MILRNGTLSDLNGIMLVEQQAFIPQIQESEDVFAQRLSAYPAGFFVLEDEEAQGTIAGYFSTELWSIVPRNKASFSLGHSALKAHTPNGTVLYLSSVALLDTYKGQGLGEFLFVETVRQICTHNMAIKHIILLVNEIWYGANHIYQKSGFKEYDRISLFFPTEQKDIFTDGILMSAEPSQICALKNDTKYDKIRIL